MDSNKYYIADVNKREDLSEVSVKLCDTNEQVAIITCFKQLTAKELVDGANLVLQLKRQLKEAQEKSEAQISELNKRLDNVKAMQYDIINELSQYEKGGLTR